MSTNTATQAAVAPETQTAVAETTAPAKKSKITDSIVNHLKTLPEDQVMTITELSEKIPGVKRDTLQVTLSQMVKSGRVEKVKTGKRQPGYKAKKA